MQNMKESKLELVEQMEAQVKLLEAMISAVKSKLRDLKEIVDDE